jgi:hypothetical protein
MTSAAIQGSDDSINYYNIVGSEIIYYNLGDYSVVAIL